MNGEKLFKIAFGLTLTPEQREKAESTVRGNDLKKVNDPGFSKSYSNAGAIAGGLVGFTGSKKRRLAGTLMGSAIGGFAGLGLSTARKSQVEDGGRYSRISNKKISFLADRINKRNQQES